mmetsp:Transcript_33137/g.47039  ORF Transcript_33137/g.47039 Transcript_33137/m.47039 type:complete len:149 (-) Transcript_33137:142-588(-)
MSIVRYVRLRVPAGNARPGPAIGQALGPLGINMAEFCKQFNDRTQETYEKETPLSVQLAAMSDRTFTFSVKTPPTSYLLKKASGIEKGPEKTSLENPIGTVTPEAIYEIAKIKQQDDLMWHLPLESLSRSIIGTARSMGLKVKESEEA